MKEPSSFTPSDRDMLINALLVLSNDQVLYEDLPKEVREVCRQAAEALQERVATPEEIAQWLDDGFTVGPFSGALAGAKFWKCSHCQMPDFDGHEQSCLIRVMAERLAGKVIPFAGSKAPSSEKKEPPCATCNDDPAVCATVPGLRHCEAAQRTQNEIGVDIKAALEGANRLGLESRSAIAPTHDDVIRNARSWAFASLLEQGSGAFLAAQLFAKEVLRLNGEPK